MATNMNYTSLVGDVRRYIERGGAISDPTVSEQIPRLINAAERKIMQSLKLQGTIEVLNDPTGLSDGVPIIAKPDRWRETVSMSIGTGSNSNSRKALLPRSYEYCRGVWPDDSETDEPEFYADYDLTHYLIAPTPDATYPIELIAYLQPMYLDESNQTNFFSTYTPNMLLYGTLLESAPFLGDDPRLQTWQALWDREAATLSSQDLQKILDRSAQRNNP